MGVENVGADRSAQRAALHAAVRLAYSSVVDLLVEHGGKLDLENNDGTSALDRMCLDAEGALIRHIGRSCPTSAP